MIRAARIFVIRTPHEDHSRRTLDSIDVLVRSESDTDEISQSVFSFRLASRPDRAPGREGKTRSYAAGRHTRDERYTVPSRNSR
jgi:hypothetical protein